MLRLCRSTHIGKEGCLLPDYDSYRRDPRRSSGERSIRTGARPSGARPQGTRTQGTRPNGNRPAGNRPPQSRRPAPRRRRRRISPRFIVIAIIAIALIVALIALLGGGGEEGGVQPNATPTVAPQNGLSNATISQSDPAAAEDSAATSADTGDAAYTTLSDWLGDEDAELTALPEEEQVKVTDLSINPDLPSEWLNVLLLGTDERTLTESARTDAMLICSINTSTGEVKLTSIMRDTAVEFDDLGKYSGTYRINSANYFGGPELAMKTVNECFGMNIQNYVTVNFFGFQKVAQALGGIEVDISEAEMDEINKRQKEQARIAYNAGIDESDQENVLLETYGENVHLNGRQTLAYARIRKSDSSDSDFTRAERQRTVLIKLMEKLRGRSAAEIMALVVSLSDNVATNMDLNTVAQIAVTVLNSNLTDVETLRLPEAGTYTEERRNEQEMFYDCDWEGNSLTLYNFIYE